MHVFESWILRGCRFFFHSSLTREGSCISAGCCRRTRGLSRLRAANCFVRAGRESGSRGPSGSVFFDPARIAPSILCAPRRVDLFCM